MICALVIWQSCTRPVRPVSGLRSLEARVSTRESVHAADQVHRRILRQQGRISLFTLPPITSVTMYTASSAAKPSSSRRAATRDRLGLIPQGSKGIKGSASSPRIICTVSFIPADSPPCEVKNDSVHTHPRPFFVFPSSLRRLYRPIRYRRHNRHVQFTHFTQTSRGFVKIISALVTCTKLGAVIFLQFHQQPSVETTKRAPLPQGRDALLGQNSALKTQTYTELPMLILRPMHSGWSYWSWK